MLRNLARTMILGLNFCLVPLLPALDFGPATQVPVSFTPALGSMGPTWSGGALIFIGIMIPPRLWCIFSRAMGTRAVR